MTMTKTHSNNNPCTVSAVRLHNARLFITFPRLAPEGNCEMPGESCAFGTLAYERTAKLVYDKGIEDACESVCTTVKGKIRQIERVCIPQTATQGKDVRHGCV